MSGDGRWIEEFVLFLTVRFLLGGVKRMSRLKVWSFIRRWRSCTSLNTTMSCVCHLLGMNPATGWGMDFTLDGTGRFSLVVVFSSLSFWLGMRERILSMPSTRAHLLWTSAAAFMGISMDTAEGVQRALIAWAVAPLHTQGLETCSRLIVVVGGRMVGKSTMGEFGRFELVIQPPFMGLTGTGAGGVRALDWGYRKKETQPDAMRLRKVFLTLTNRCNARCAHCDIGADRISTWTENIGVHNSRCSFSEIRTLLAELAAFPKPLDVYVTGGEPLLEADLLADILLYLPQHHSLSIVTNGILLSSFVDRMDAEALARIGTLNISIDGPPGVHEEIRGLRKPMNWTLLWRGIHMLDTISKRAGHKIDLHFNVVILPGYHRCLPDLADFLVRRLGEWSPDGGESRTVCASLDLLHFQYQATHAKIPGRNRGYQYKRGQEKEIAQSIADVKERCAAVGMSVLEFPRLVGDDAIQAWYSGDKLSGVVGAGVVCSAPQNSVQVLPGGRVIFNTHCYDPRRFSYRLGERMAGGLRTRFAEFARGARSLLPTRVECLRCCLLYGTSGTAKPSLG